MKILFGYFLIILQLQHPMILFDFNTTADISNWVIVDDVVMGGRSTGAFRSNEEGNGVFQGNVSLENNGGFSSVRYRFSPINMEGFTKVTIRVKGDHGPFQFRVKTNAAEYYSYVATFDTFGAWTTIEIPFSAMYPAFRGQKLAAPNYPGKKMEEIAFLIGNKKATAFKLEIDKIIVE